MRFSVEAWDPGYGASSDSLGESSAETVLDVEVAPAGWAPLDPAPVTRPAEVLFVDGVRRVDAQVWVDEPDGTASPALCATSAAGVVRCGPDGARLVAADIRRGLFTTAPDAVDVPTTAGIYRVRHTAFRPDVAPGQVLSLAVQRDLAEIEAAVSTVPRAAGDLLVVDGPLRGRQHLPRALGFVKSHRSDYLPPALGGIVARLAAGQRTPAFLLGTSWQRYTWYLRLPCRGGAPWAGIVRVECDADLPMSEAVELATLSQVTLPRFASAEYKDARAPQNLYPIAGLERELRKRLGEPSLLYRALRRAAA